MRRLLGLLSLTLALAGGPSGAIEVCRESPLGISICSGVPTHGLDGLDPYPPAHRAPRVAPTLIPAQRTNAFGDTTLQPSETTTLRPRPRVCRPDSFGDLTC